MSRFSAPVPRPRVAILALATLVPFIAEVSLPAVAATFAPATAGAGVASDHSRHAAEHHHPGCPWRERGPCPHRAAAESPGGPGFAPCAESPAQPADGTAFLPRIAGRVVGWRLGRIVRPVEPMPRGELTPLDPPAPEPRPPRAPSGR
ncbi:MAG TPA: hypothetical protein VJP59_04510 [Gemmatimonadota bacterium]|nr:hypothetical protein [Gemmatimonadota bacterium]